MKGFTPCVLLVAAAALALSCATVPPATSPSPSVEPAARAWLTIEDQGEFVGWAELTDFSQEIFKPEAYIPAMPGVKAFSDAFLAKTRVSADGVTVVRKVGAPFAGTFREILNTALQKAGYPELSVDEFREALRHRQLTCHGSMTTARFDEDGRPLPGEYACIAGLKCVNDLLFSVSPPDDKHRITASIAVMNWDASKGSDSVACRQDWPQQEVASQSVEESAHSKPRLVSWDQLLPILQGITSLETTHTKQKGICPGNISPEGMNMGLVVSVSYALNAFARHIGGMDVFLGLVTGNGESPSLWKDPCFPAELEPFLGKEHVMLLGGDEFRLECEASKGAAVGAAVPSVN